jgi:hypothetical protein
MGQRGRWMIFLLFALSMVLVVLGGSCSLSPINLGEWYEGTLTPSDENGPDSYGWIFYYDTYRIPVEYGKDYEIEFYADSSSVVFEGDAEDDIMHADPSGATDTFTAESDGGEYYVYVKGTVLNDYAGYIEYSFRITEQ